MPKVFDLRRYEWRNRTINSHRKVFPWDDMRNGDQIILPLCDEPKKHRNHYTKNARSSLKMYGDKKKRSLYLSARLLSKDEGQGDGYICTMTVGDADTYSDLTPKHDWSNVKVGDIVTFPSHEQAYVEACNLIKQSRDPSSPLPATLAADTFQNTVRVMFFKSGRKQSPVPQGPPPKRGPVVVPWSKVAVQLSDDAWKEEIRKATKIKKEMGGDVIDKDRETGFVTVNDDQGRVLWMNDVAKDYFDGLSDQYNND